MILFIVHFQSLEVYTQAKMIQKKLKSKLPTAATHNIISLLKYTLCTLYFVIFTHYAISIKVENSYFLRIFKYKVSQKEVQNIIYNMPLTIWVTLPCLHIVHKNDHYFAKVEIVF